MPPDGHERNSYGECHPKCPECIEQRKKHEARIEHMKKVGKEWADLRAERDTLRKKLTDAECRLDLIHAVFHREHGRAEEIIAEHVEMKMRAYEDDGSG